MKLLRDFFLLFIIAVVFYFSSPFFLKNLLPIPADTIVGLYHPFRDLYADKYPRGIPFKNFLITDPVRQIYPWKTLALDSIKNGQLPIWNPYEMAGKPLLANFQSSSFYPLNVLFFIFPYEYAWGILILIQPLLAGVFLYFYLIHMKIRRSAAAFGALAFAFSGFSVAWLEWGTIVHTILWLPLIFLAKEHLVKKISAKWIMILIISECSLILAGHLQTVFYAFVMSNSYLCARIIQEEHRKSKKDFLVRSLISYVPFLFIGVIIFVITTIQLLPTFQFILLSARNVDQLFWEKKGWFIPWQHLIQFVAPDFFGNPTTLNYWGVWNYAEFLGYIGVVPLLFALYALFFRRDTKTLFFTVFVFIPLLFALPTPVAKLPYILNIPFLSTSQPTRLLSIICLSFSILGAFGLDYFLSFTRVAKKIPLSLIAWAGLGLFLYSVVWGSIFFNKTFFPTIKMDDILTAKRNLYLPTLLLFSTLLISGSIYFIRSKRIKLILVCILLIFTAFDLIRFVQKFESFSKTDYLFPNTKILEYLKKDQEIYRVAVDDSRILPPNFLTYYKIQSIEGYDPLYLLSYGEFIAFSEHGRIDMSSSLGFNRIITPHNLNSPLIDLLNVKYLLSFSDLDDKKFELVAQEGTTKLYKNKLTFPRVFFVDNILFLNSKEKILETMLALNLRKNAVVWGPSIEQEFSLLTVGQAEITHYTENEIRIHTNNTGDGFLVFSDVYYPTWRASLDNNITLKIFKTNYTFRGVFIPKGQHDIVFTANIF